MEPLLFLSFVSHLAILSIVGNLLVLFMAYKRSSQMKPPEFLSVNLAVTDLGAAVSMYPLSVASLWNHSWLGGDATCIYYGWMGFFFGVASMATLTVMAVVRFSASTTLLSQCEYCRNPFLIWTMQLGNLATFNQGYEMPQELNTQFA